MNLFSAKFASWSASSHLAHSLLLGANFQSLKKAALTFVAAAACLNGLPSADGLPTANAWQDSTFDADDAANLERMLAAGEYTLAIQTAKQSDDSRLMQRISDHQNQHGAIASSVALSRDAYYESSSSSSDDRSAGLERRYGGSPTGAAGGQVQADFTSLINLIETTVDPLSWESAGGFGVITPYTNGVLIDVSGRLGLSEKLNQSNSRLLDSHSPMQLTQQDGLTFISLPKLEQELLRRARAGQGIPPSLKYLDGLYDIRYIMLDKANGDLMLVGPSGPWEENQQGIAVNIETGKAVMQLDDLVVCLRTVMAGKGVVGCSIDPRPGQFQQIAEYLQNHRVTNEKKRDKMRAVVGPQDAVVFGVPTTSHTAHVLLTADYHLKLLAMGNVDAGRTLPSYLDLCGPNDPPTEVIRWWFTLGEPEVQKNPTGDVFLINGTPLQLKTESQLVNRKKAANNSLAAEQFVGKFNQQFDKVQQQFPLYGQLENIFELALAAQVIHSNHLPEALHWHADFLVGRQATDRFQIQKYRPITEVELVLNHRKLKFRQNGKIVEQTVTAVSGGVDIQTSKKQVQRMTQTVENRSIPGDFFRSMEQVQADPIDQTSDHFRWSRKK